MSQEKVCDLSECPLELKTGKKFCGECGRPNARIVWSLSVKGNPSEEREITEALPAAKDKLSVLPNDIVVLKATNLGNREINVKITHERLHGLTSQDRLTDQFVVGPDRSVEFHFQHSGTAGLKGSLTLHSRTAVRPDEKWWERPDWEKVDIRVTERLQAAKADWFPKSPTIYFPANGGCQWVRMWNLAPSTRPLKIVRPSQGFDVAFLKDGNKMDERECSVDSGKSIDLCITRTEPDLLFPDTVEVVLNDDIKLNIELLEHHTISQETNYDVIVAIDFGTRNTSIRMKWLNAADDQAGRPYNVSLPIPDKEHYRFPSLMIYNADGRIVMHGTKAQKYLEELRQDALKSGQVIVDDLKTSLRAQHYLNNKFSPPIHSKELLAEYFEKILEPVEAELKAHVGRDRSRVLYVLCHPVVLDHQNDNDREGYKDCLEYALKHCCPSDPKIHWLPESDAATYYFVPKMSDLDRLIDDDAASIVVVVDSGGGTTDITYSQASIDGHGKLSLIPRARVSFDLEQTDLIQSALRRFPPTLTETQFGGDVLDKVIVHYLCEPLKETAEHSLLSFGSEGAGVFNECTPVRAEDIADDLGRRIALSHARSFKEDLGKNSGAAVQIASEFSSEPQLNTFQVQITPPNYQASVLEKILKPAIFGYKSKPVPLDEQWKDRPPGTRYKIRQVFYVGGTCFDSQIRTRFSELFSVVEQGEEVILNDEDRWTAVIEGALQIEEQHFVTLPFALYFNPNLPGEQEQRLEMPGGGISVRGKTWRRIRLDLPSRHETPEWKPQLIIRPLPTTPPTSKATSSVRQRQNDARKQKETLRTPASDGESQSVPQSSPETPVSRVLAQGYFKNILREKKEIGVRWYANQEEGLIFEFILPGERNFDSSVDGRLWRAVLTNRPETIP